MKTLLIILLGLICICSGRSQNMIVLEPDNYAVGTVLNTIIPQVTLNTAGNDNRGIFNVTVAAPILPPPPTGNNAFSHVGIPFFNDTRRLRMDFNGLVGTLSIDFQGSNPLATETGRMDVYDSWGSLLTSYTTAPLLSGQAETMSATRTMPDIAWAVAYTLPGESVFGRLDRLMFSQPVPEPSTAVVWGVGLGLSGLILRRRSRR